MLVDANIFQPLISVFAAVILYFHRSVGLSWGWSIILLTVCVRLVLIPLTIRQFHSMRRLQAHQPDMKALQQKYKDDKQRQQQEMMKFYKEKNVNPLGSCLPMVLQLPVFISLYYMLRENLRTDICDPIQKAYRAWYAAKNKISLKAAAGQTTYCTNPQFAHHPVHGAGFLFIHDITNTAHGVTLVVLLILYVGTQMVSTLIMAGPTMDKSQRQMMMAMPVLFVLFIIRFPSGLIVYWITTNAWTMGQQFVLRQVFGPPQVANAVMAAEQLKEDAEAAERGLSSRLRQLVAGRPAAGGGRGRDGGGDVGRSGSGPNGGRPPGGPPPRPPRKKKKRSGRRR